MHISCLIIIPSWALGALAQNSPSSSTTSTQSPTSTSSTPGVQTVTVGDNNALAFSPDSIKADVGSTIEFQFYPPIHSVTQSSFNSPCAPLANRAGFWSGAITTTGDGTNPSVFTLVINDTNPVWFYCATIGHFESGMVGVINPPRVTEPSRCACGRELKECNRSDDSETLDGYKSAASKVSSPPTPSAVQGGSFGPPKAASTGSSTSGSPTSQSATSSAATTTPTKSAGVKNLDTGGIVLWAPVALAGLLAVVLGSLII